MFGRVVLKSERMVLHLQRRYTYTAYRGASGSLEIVVLMVLMVLQVLLVLMVIMVLMEMMVQNPLVNRASRRVGAHFTCVASRLPVPALVPTWALALEPASLSLPARPSQRPAVLCASIQTRATSASSTSPKRTA